MGVRVGLTLLILGYAPVAFAQPADWVIVPISTDDNTSWMHPTARTIGSALSVQGARVLSPERAVALFEQDGSRPPVEVTDAQIQRLDSLTKEALQLIVVQEPGRAFEVLRSARKLIDDSVTELNRTTSLASDVLDTCLYMVRALRDTRDLERAKELAKQCVRLVPGGKADPQEHPPEVVQLHEEARRPGPDKTGSISIDSTPQGCNVRIHGVGLGPTPFTATGLYPGDYQVQVECDPDRRGRVHRVTVEAGKAEVFVDVEFDEAVRTRPRLRLQYADKPKARRQARDAHTIAEVLQVSAVVVASVPSADVLELHVRRTDSNRVSFVRIPMTPIGPTGKVAADAAAALVGDQCKDFTGRKPLAIECPGAPPGPRRPPRAQWISGLTLVSAGGASLLASYGLVIWRRDTGNVVVEQIEVNPSDTSNQSQWLSLRTGIVASAATGGVLTVTAMPLLLPYRSKTPWWAWLSGGLGVGLAVGSIVSGATAESAPAGNSKCNTEFASVEEAQVCVDRGRSLDRTVVLGATAAPLLTMPLVYLLRRDDKKDVQSVTPSVAFGPTGGSLSFRGRF